jgi:hypothetical protein
MVLPVLQAMQKHPEAGALWIFDQGNASRASVTSNQILPFQALGQTLSWKQSETHRRGSDRGRRAVKT